MLLELAFVLLLILANGALAMSEIAIVSSRRGRLRAQAERGDRGARIALGLAEAPGRFLSTVQIGITLVGVLAGAFSGATVGLRLAAALPALGVPETIAQEVGVGIVVVAITYLSLIVGELVPKQIALAAPERVAARVAPAMLALSRIAAPVVWLLDRSGRLLLRALGQGGQPAPQISDEDIRMMLVEAAGAGVIHKREREMMGGVMRLADGRARALMTPSAEVETAEAGEDLGTILARFRNSGHSRLPLRRGGSEDILGVLHGHDLLTAQAAGFDAARAARPAPAVPATLPALDVIERLRDSPGHMLLVHDARGRFAGIITPMDILGAIAGGFDESPHAPPEVVERDDGSLLVAGAVPMDELADRIGLVGGDWEAATAAGFVRAHLDGAPAEGRHVRLGDWRVEVVDMDGPRIDRLLVERAPE